MDKHSQRTLFIGLAISGVVILMVSSFSYNRTTEQLTFLVVNGLAILALITMISNAITADKQLRVSENQGKEVELQRIAQQDANDRTDRIIKQNESMVKTMRAQLKAMQDQNTMGEQSLELAKLSAKITEDQLQLAKLTQRPEIDLRLTFDRIGPDRRIRMLLNTPNVGQTTAYRFGIHICVEWMPANYDDWLEYKEPVSHEAEPIRVGIPHFVHPDAVTPPIQTIVGMIDGSIWMIVYGIYWYYDGAVNRYEEIFCRRFNHLQTDQAVQCPDTLRAKVVKYAPK